MNDSERTLGVVIGKLEGLEKRIDDHEERETIEHERILDKLDSFGIWKAGVTAVVGAVGVMLGYLFK